MNDFVVKQGIQLGGSVKGNAKSVALSVNGYDLGVAAYDGVSFSVAAENSSPVSVSFRPDGTKMYLLGNSGDNVYEYNLSTAWDVSTASYFQNFSVASQEFSVSGLFLKPDGTKFYVVGTVYDTVFEYSVSAAWDISTASYVQGFSVSAQETTPEGVFFKSDGLKMYIVGTNGIEVNEYDLSTAWDISTATYLQNFSVSAQQASPRDVFFRPDGIKMYIVGVSSATVSEYTLSTAWNISTASFVQNFSLGAQETFPEAIFFGNSGAKMYIVGDVNDTIYQYTTGTFTSLDLSTADAFEVTPTADVTLGFSNPPAAGNAQAFSVALTGANVGASYDIANAVYDSVSFSVGVQEISPYKVAFNSTGTKMYIVGLGSDTVFQYSLSTGFDLSTASYDSVSFSVASQDPDPAGLTFNNDGTKMYMLGYTNDSVFQYSLSTGFDLSTASYDSVSFSVASQDGFPFGITFNNDGTKMYITGFQNDTVFQYSLSTAFDVSTASYDSVSFSVASQDGNPLDVAFNSTGTKMYMVGISNGRVYQYSLSTAFDLSTASYDSVSFSVASQDVAPFGIVFNNDGTKMYIMGNNTTSVFQYTTGTSDIATITYPASVQWSGGTAPTTPADGVTDLLTFYTEDGGNTYYGFKVGDALA